MPAAQVMIESQYETGYTTGDTGNGLDRDHTDYLYRYVLRLLPRNAATSESSACEKVFTQGKRSFSGVQSSLNNKYKI